MRENTLYRREEVLSGETTCITWTSLKENTFNVVATIVSRRVTQNTDNVQQFSCFWIFLWLFFVLNSFCASIIDRKNIVFVVSKLVEPSWRHDQHNSDNVQHILNTYGHIFRLILFIADTRIDSGQNDELHYVFTRLLAE